MPPLGVGKQSIGLKQRFQRFGEQTLRRGFQYLPQRGQVLARELFRVRGQEDIQRLLDWGANYLFGNIRPTGAQPVFAGVGSEGALPPRLPLCEVDRGSIADQVLLASSESATGGRTNFATRLEIEIAAWKALELKTYQAKQRYRRTVALMIGLPLLAVAGVTAAAAAVAYYGLEVALKVPAIIAVAGGTAYAFTPLLFALINPVKRSREAEKNYAELFLQTKKIRDLCKDKSEAEKVAIQLRNFIDIEQRHTKRLHPRLVDEAFRKAEKEYADAEELELETDDALSPPATSTGEFDALAREVSGDAAADAFARLQAALERGNPGGPNRGHEGGSAAREAATWRSTARGLLDDATQNARSTSENLREIIEPLQPVLKAIDKLERRRSDEGSLPEMEATALETYTKARDEALERARVLNEQIDTGFAAVFLSLAEMPAETLQANRADAAEIVRDTLEGIRSLGENYETRITNIARAPRAVEAAANSIADNATLRDIIREVLSGASESRAFEVGVCQSTLVDLYRDYTAGRTVWYEGVGRLVPGLSSFAEICSVSLGRDAEDFTSFFGSAEQRSLHPLISNLSILLQDLAAQTIPAGQLEALTYVLRISLNILGCHPRGIEIINRVAQTAIDNENFRFAELMRRNALQVGGQPLEDAAGRIGGALLKPWGGRTVTQIRELHPRLEALRRAAVPPQSEDRLNRIDALMAIHTEAEQILAEIEEQRGFISPTDIQRMQNPTETMRNASRDLAREEILYEITRQSDIISAVAERANTLDPPAHRADIANALTAMVAAVTRGNQHDLIRLTDDSLESAHRAAITAALNSAQHEGEHALAISSAALAALYQLEQIECVPDRHSFVDFNARNVSHAAAGAPEFFVSATTELLNRLATFITDPATYPNLPRGEAALPLISRLAEATERLERSSDQSQVNLRQTLLTVFRAYEDDVIAPVAGESPTSIQTRALAAIERLEEQTTLTKIPVDDGSGGHTATAGFRGMGPFGSAYPPPFRNLTGDGREVPQFVVLDFSGGSAPHHHAAVPAGISGGGGVKPLLPAPADRREQPTTDRARVTDSIELMSLDLPSITETQTALLEGKPVRPDEATFMALEFAELGTASTRSALTGRLPLIALASVALTERRERFQTRFDEASAALGEIERETESVTRESADQRERITLAAVDTVAQLTGFRADAQQAIMQHRTALAELEAEVDRISAEKLEDPLVDRDRVTETARQLKEAARTSTARGVYPAGTNHARSAFRGLLQSLDDIAEARGTTIQQAQQTIEGTPALLSATERQRNREIEQVEVKHDERLAALEERRTATTREISQREGSISEIDEALEALTETHAQVIERAAGLEVHEQVANFTAAQERASRELTSITDALERRQQLQPNLEELLVISETWGEGAAALGLDGLHPLVEIGQASLEALPKEQTRRRRILDGPALDEFQIGSDYSTELSQMSARITGQQALEIARRELETIDRQERERQQRSDELIQQATRDRKMIEDEAQRNAEAEAALEMLTPRLQEPLAARVETFNQAYREAAEQATALAAGEGVDVDFNDIPTSGAIKAYTEAVAARVAETRQTAVDSHWAAFAGDENNPYAEPLTEGMLRATLLLYNQGNQSGNFSQAMQGLLANANVLAQIALTSEVENRRDPAATLLINVAGDAARAFRETDATLVGHWSSLGVNCERIDVHTDPNLFRVNLRGGVQITIRLNDADEIIGNAEISIV